MLVLDRYFVATDRSKPEQQHVYKVNLICLHLNKIVQHLTMLAYWSKYSSKQFSGGENLIFLRRNPI